MKKLVFMLVFIGLISFENYGQNEKTTKTKYNTWSATISGGSMLFYGDLRQFGIYPVTKKNSQDWYGLTDGLSEYSTGFGLAISKQLHPIIGIQGMIEKGNLSGLKIKTNAHFNASFYSYGLNVKIYFLPLINPNAESPRFAIYGITGFGLCNFKSMQTKISSGEIIHSFGYGNHGQEERLTHESYIPVGLGLKYKINNKFDIGFESTFKYVNTDKLDARVKENSAEDMYGYNALTLSYKFGKNEKNKEWDLSKDQDNDGVSDKKDKCPDTPADVNVDEVGCPLDGDGDGVADYLDKCPSTPKEAKVDKSGCPLDTDGDGVADYLDKCASTPKGAKVDTKGCPFDTDQDGVIDFNDKCENTPKGTPVDATGCPLDADSDGVLDNVDKCAGTPANVKVDATGCPLDTDGDGIADYLDKCPNEKGVEANKGCPEIKKEDKALLEKALQGIYFDTGKDVIKPASYKILDNIAKLLNTNTQFNVLIKGHADSDGDDKFNDELSQKRADAVKNYLISKEVKGNRLTAKGYGETQPLSDNKTAAGKAKNRRVEFAIEF